jgi:hypothetical protein
MDSARIKRKTEFYKEKTSILLLKVAQKDKLNLKILKNLKLSAGRVLKINDWDKCKKPDGLEINLSGFVFYDVIFFEEFADMKASISLLSQLNRQNKIFRVNRKIAEWYSRINENPNLLGNENLGYYDFEKLDGIKYLKGAQIYLLHISPSIVILSISVDVNDKCRNEFKSIISSEPLPLFNITTINFMKDFIGWQSQPGIYRRNFEINSLVSLVQSEMKFVRQKYLNFGNYYDLSFPSLQIYSIKNSLESLIKNKNEKSYYKFLESFGFRIGYSFNDQNENWFLISKNEIANNSFSYIVICSAEDYKKTEQSSYANMQIAFNDYANEFSGILALNSYLSIINKKIMLVRNDINPLLLKNHWFFSKIKRGFSILNLVTNLDYKLERISKEIENLRFVFHSFTDIDNIKMTSLKKEYIFKDELINGYNYLLKENKNYLEFIKTSFRDFISFRTMFFNYKIQFRVFWLTVLVIIISILVLIPERARNDFFLEIFNTLKNFLLQ